MVASIAKKLRKCHSVRQCVSEVGFQVPDFGRIRTPTSQQGKTRRTAYSLLAVSSRKCHPARSEAIQVRSLCLSVAIATQRRSQIIDRDKQHIGRTLVGGPRQQRDRCRGDPKENGKNGSHRRQTSVRVSDYGSSHVRFLGDRRIVERRQSCRLAREASRCLPTCEVCVIGRWRERRWRTSSIANLEEQR